jgi:hypothetical protein
LLFLLGQLFEKNEFYDFSGMLAVDRLKQLERLYLCGAPYDSESFSLETLLDSLVCLYDECCSSTLRRERAIAEFVDFGKCGYKLIITFRTLAKPVVSQVKALRLSRDDFEVLKIIGRGSFGEVAVVQLKDTDQVNTSPLLNSHLLDLDLCHENSEQMGDAETCRNGVLSTRTRCHGVWRPQMAYQSTFRIPGRKEFGSLLKMIINIYPFLVSGHAILYWWRFTNTHVQVRHQTARVDDEILHC